MIFTEEQLVEQFENRMKSFDIPKYVNDNVPRKIKTSWESIACINEDDMDHIAYCMDSLIEYLRGGMMPGGFIQAVVRNDFVDAVTRADGANVRALTVYARFIYNHVPRELLQLRREELTEK